MINTNVLGSLYTTHAALPIMKQQKSGHIVNVSSNSGRIASKGEDVYDMTKWGMCGFSESLRQEVALDNIRVTVIEPGGVTTEFMNHITDLEAKKRVDEYFKHTEALKGKDIAAAIVYAVTQPPHVSVNEMLIRPTAQITP